MHFAKVLLIVAKSCLQIVEKNGEAQIKKYQIWHQVHGHYKGLSHVTFMFAPSIEYIQYCSV